MIPRAHADELAELTGALTADGWEPIEPPTTERDADRLAGISFRLLTSPGREILVTANWRESAASTSFASLDPADPRTALWHAEAVNLPVSVLTAVARAALAEPLGPGPVTLLRAAGWLRQPFTDTGHGTSAVVYHDPAGGRWAAANYLRSRGRLERGPWLIARDDVETSGGHRAYAHTDWKSPGGVIAALALTTDETNP